MRSLVSRVLLTTFLTVVLCSLAGAGGRYAMLEVQYQNELQAAMLWSNAFPEQAVRYAQAINDKNIPIRFYGLCVDQDGNRLEGVKLTLSVRQWKGMSRLDLRAIQLRRDFWDGLLSTLGLQ